MKNQFFSSYFFLISVLCLLAACDNDSNEIGANIVGDDNFEFGTPEFYSVNAYNQVLGPVEISNLPVQQFGIYDNPVFGKMTAQVVTQLELAVENPAGVTGGLDLAKSPKIKSAILTVPYYSHVTDPTDLATASIYELDSIYGKKSKLDLQIYESNFYQRDIDPTTGGTQKYYSDQISQFVNNMGTDLLNDKLSDPKQNTEFVFDSIGKLDPATEVGGYQIKAAPRMQIELDTAYFHNKILSAAGVAGMVNNNVFKNYFRGLHFKVAQSGSEPGNMAMMNFAQGKVTITYTQSDSTDEKKLVLNLSGNNVNLVQSDYSAAYNTVLGTPTNVNGDEKLYLKGGAGSMAVIELFKNPGELEELRSHRDQWLVNDASLSFYIENSASGMGQGTPKAEEPNRVYLYDINNKRILIDHLTDQSTSFNSVKYNKKLLGGTIVRTDGRGTSYKIRITNHIRKLIANDSVKNVRLGLVVTENINDTSNISLKTPKVLPVSGTFAPFTIKKTPKMNVVNPFGTILWGSVPSVPEDKKVKLTIYYTKPNQ